MKKILLLAGFFATTLSHAQSPNLQWAKSFDFTSNNGALLSSIETDAAGNVYSTGDFVGTGDFDPGSSTYTIATNSNSDIFISKLDAAGNFVWAKSLVGTNGVDDSQDIAVDATGNVYTTGYFTGTTDFDPGAASYPLISSNASDIFISKLDVNGDFVWAKQIGNTTSAETANSIALDALGNVYVTGTYSATLDFDPGAATYTLGTAGGNDIFVLKLDANGNFIWAKSMGGSGSDKAYAIALDASANIHTTGTFGGTADFDPAATSYTLASHGNFDVFISKLDNNGNFIWAKDIGGSSSEEGNAITVDAAGNVYTTGFYQSTADFNPNSGTNNITAFLGKDIFISKLDAAGNYVWAKSFGSTGDDAGTSIKTDAAGNVYSTGNFFYTVYFDPSFTNSLTSNGGVDTYVCKLDANGNFVWATSTGGTGDDRGYSVTVDAANNVYTGGRYQATCDFDPSSGTYTMTAPPNTTNLFVLKTGQSSSTGIKDHGEENSISIYPNPNNGIFHVTVPVLPANTIIEIYNSTGVLVQTLEMQHEQNRIDLTTQPAGLYFIKVISGTRLIAAQKIIKH